MSAVRYRLSMPEPHTHLYEVEVRLSCVGGPVELVMPSWTPGSYLLREFARNVQDFAAETAGGDPLPWRKLDKSRWRIDAEPGAEVRARYRVYANELTVRTSHLDSSHAYVNGASVFMFARGREEEPLELDVNAPAGWEIATALPRGGEGRFRAAGYDQLVDCPLEIGTHTLLEWEQDGIPHRYAIWGRADYDADRLVADTRRIIDAARGLFGGGLPYSEYLFILHILPEGRGGLEHASSCSLQASRSAFEGAEYENFLALVAHEFFHVWNVKRIRPEPLGPFDYTRENYTRNLWVAEGLTSYYTDLILRWAGIITPERYLQRLGESIARLQALPGRFHQTLEESSFDAWIKFYRPDEHTPNAQISYYHKGALVGLLLDLEIRRATDGLRSLDDVMRLLWERYGSRDVGFPEDPARGIRAVAEEIARRDLAEFFRAYVQGTEELDYDRYLGAAGYRLGTDASTPAEGPGLGGTRASPTRIGDAAIQETRLGVRTREHRGAARVTVVLQDTAAYRAGVNAGDEIVAIDGLRVGHAELAGRLRRRTASEALRLTLFRRDELLDLNVKLGPEPAPGVRIVEAESPTDGERAVRRAWLHLERATAGGGVDPEGETQ